MNGIDLIAEERRSHVTRGYGPEHDRKHAKGELVLVAGILLLQKMLGAELADIIDTACAAQPWLDKIFKKERSRLDTLIVAGSLIAAAIDQEIEEIGRE